MNTRLTKKDFIFVIIMIVLAGIFFLYNHISDNSNQKQVLISVGGTVIERCSLDKDDQIIINQGTNTLTIKDGKAYMSHADCPDQICVNQGEISNSKESIICLPNKVVVEIRSQEDKDFDIIAR